MGDAGRGGAVAGTDLQVMMLGCALMTGGAAPWGMRLLVCSEKGAPRKGGSPARDRRRGREGRVAGSWGGGKDEGLQRLGVVVVLRGRREQAASSPDPGAPERNGPRSSASYASSRTSCRKGSRSARSPRRAAAAAASPARTAPREGFASCGRGPGRSGHRTARSRRAPRASRPRRGVRPHLSAGAARTPSSAKGLNQPQKPLSARRSSATCWVLDSWRSG